MLNSWQVGLRRKSLQQDVSLYITQSPSPLFIQFCPFLKTHERNTDRGKTLLWDEKKPYPVLTMDKCKYKFVLTLSIVVLLLKIPQHVKESAPRNLFFVNQFKLLQQIYRSTKNTEEEYLVFSLNEILLYTETESKQYPFNLRYF